MKKLLLTGLILAVAAAAPAFAGDGECGHETQACLDYLAKMSDRGYAGIEFDEKNHEAMVVSSVVEGAPAQKAGLKPGDTLVAINGLRMSEEGAMYKIQEAMTPGNTVSVTFTRNGKEKKSKVTLIEMPDAVHAKLVGEHMLQHATTEVASK